MPSTSKGVACLTRCSILPSGESLVTREDSKGPSQCCAKHIGSGSALASKRPQFHFLGSTAACLVSRLLVGRTSTNGIPAPSLIGRSTTKMPSIHTTHSIDLSKTTITSCPIFGVTCLS